MDDQFARINNICLIFISLIIGTVALAYMKPVMIPLIFSIFTYSILTPLVQKIATKGKVPKPLAIVLALALLFFMLTLLVGILITSIENFVEGAPKYRQSLFDSINFVQSYLNQFHIDFDLAKIRETIRSLPLLAYAQNFTGQLLSFFGNLFLIFIFTVFMMAGESRVDSRSPLLQEVLQKVSSYVGSKFLLSLATGILIWILLLSFGVELAFIFGLLTILFNFIPTIGSIAAVALPLPIVFLQYQFSWPFFAILIVSTLIQFTIGNVIEPKIMGDSMDLHPITVLVCLIFWGMVWGIPGMFLAVPITAVLKIIFARVDATQAFAEILAGRLPTRD